MSKFDPGVIILALNSGSSSLKFGLYRVASEKTEILLSGSADAIGEKGGRVQALDARGMTVLDEATPYLSQTAAAVRLEKLLTNDKTAPPSAIGHRIVHGGPELRSHRLINDGVLTTLAGAAAFAPLHVPGALRLIRFAQQWFPATPQVACFDTAFHSSLPDVARVLPVAKALQLEGIQKYGFHGLSCESIVRQLQPAVPERLIIAHLGNGASITAVKEGRSVDTSMGLTPTGGVMMGTRSGDLDPGLLVYLGREKGYDAAKLEILVDHHSGLLGVSGVSSDVRTLHEVSGSDTDARLALDMFAYTVRKQIAAMIAVLEGVDLLVFTGGIGENDSKMRSAICSGLSWAGIGLDQRRNAAVDNPISSSERPCRVLVLPCQEDEEIARHAAALVLH